MTYSEFEDDDLNDDEFDDEDLSEEEEEELEDSLDKYVKERSIREPELPELIRKAEQNVENALDRNSKEYRLMEEDLLRDLSSWCNKEEPTFNELCKILESHKIIGDLWRTWGVYK